MSESAPAFELIDGRYRIERILARGGGGLIAAATHLSLGRQVAVKVLLPAGTGSEEAIARFEREARIVATLRGEHIVRIFDAGSTTGNVPFLVMELLEGEDLGALIQREAPLDVERLVDIVLQACEALAEAHRVGIVHRDLKPHNLFLERRADERPFVKVLDFGISKLSAELRMKSGDRTLTEQGVVMGSPAYMSPEQMKNAHHVDARADIWSLGAILYRGATGKLPFTAQALPKLCVQVLMHDPPAPRTLVPDLPEALEAITLRCLQKDPDKRYADVAELAEALGELAPPHAKTLVGRTRRNLSATIEPDDEVMVGSLSSAVELPVRRNAIGEDTAMKAIRAARRRATLKIAALGAAIAASVAAVAAIGISTREPSANAQAETAVLAAPVLLHAAAPSAAHRRASTPLVPRVSTRGVRLAPASPSAPTPAPAPTPEPAPTAPPPGSPHPEFGGRK